jgi:hypothetical protein
MFQDEDGEDVIVTVGTFRTILEQGNATYRPGMARVAFQDGTDLEQKVNEQLGQNDLCDHRYRINRRVPNVSRIGRGFLVGVGETRGLGLNSGHETHGLGSR